MCARCPERTMNQALETLPGSSPVVLDAHDSRGRRLLVRSVKFHTPEAFIFKFMNLNFVFETILTKQLLNSKRLKKNFEEETDNDGQYFSGII